MDNPQKVVAHPTQKYTFILREGIVFEYSGRMDESEIILNSTHNHPGTCLGLSELYQMAFFCGHTEYSDQANAYKSRPLRGRKLNQRSYSKDDRWSSHTYLAEDAYKHYKYDGGRTDGFIKLDIYDNAKLEIRSRWGYKGEPKANIELTISDVLTLIQFLEENPSTELEAKKQNDFSKRFEKATK